MEKSLFNKKLLIASSLSVLLTACASNQLAVSDSIQQKSAQAASDATFTPEQAIDEAEKKLNKAKQQGLTFFSPLHLKQAEESIAQAREYLVEPSEIKNAPLMAAIAASQYIENAYSNKKKVEATLKNSLKGIEVVRSLNAQTVAPEQYMDVIDSLSDIIEDIEQGNVVEARDQEIDLLVDIADLEINTLKITHLNEAISFIDRASEIDADEFAELTFDKAESTLDASTKFIEKNYRNREGVKAAGIDALIAAKKAYYVALEAQELVKMDAESAEKHTLEVMSLFNKMHLAAKGEDITPNKLFNQSELIISIIEDYKNKIKTLSNTPSKSQAFSAPPSTELKIETINDASVQVVPLSGLESDQETKEEEPTLQSDEGSFDSSEIVTEDTSSQVAEEAEEPVSEVVEAENDSKNDTEANSDEVAEESAEQGTTAPSDSETTTTLESE